MLVAAKTLAATAIDWFKSPSMVETAKKDLEEHKKGHPFRLLTPLNRRPPIVAEAEEKLSSARFSGRMKAMRLLPFVGSFALLLSFTNHTNAQQSTQQRVVPLKTFPIDQRFETVSGDPTKAGGLYVIRIHAEAGYIIMPHTHPEDENIVVVEGSWALGMGDRYHENALQPMELGAYGLVPKKMAHFALSKTDTIIQVHGVGPFTTHWVVPMYELTEKGVLLETSASEPGRPTSTSPPGCFNLKLGTRVRGSYGEGFVAGAQCTPGQLTQYLVQKADRERFWAQGEKLKIL